MSACAGRRHVWWWALRPAFLRRAAASIALPEIDFALARLGGLIDQLRLLRRKIDRLAAMRRSLDAAAAPAPQPAASFSGAQGRTGHRNGGADPR